MNPSQNPLVVIAGPTASGKSSLALELARHNQGELICADSRQIYRELNIGTAKPSLSEQEEIPHHLFDIADPRETFTVTQYLLAAEQALHAIWQRGKLPIFVGGTGLYLKTLLYAYQIPEVAPQPELRAELLKAESEKGEGYLHTELHRIDPPSAERLHPHDLRRIIRALEVYRVTGQALSEQQSRSSELRYSCIYLGLSMPRALLEQRIVRRIQAMIDGGLVEEVKALRERYGADLPLLQTLNYREIADFLDSKTDLKTAQAEMHIHTRQYAKRQMTWFRKDPGIHWVELEQEDLRPAREWLIKQGLQFPARKAA
ncbi:tRNA (adenosine(37)-N6)-dimethylallyltransferase MiaA [bacterium (Candidatus Blackallbacteria) CG17_big_fil_post_rev_8_21_14_2_50_48_46]|uniref:tRNA dimethylallyltransferase n=1 Tax=bacterium (Candidatus Blackallbacteria) CG17_big_fil_post_rev_8_21_14_2_50_48_46 TaxID=2014261 RepID=A0A2M7G549_9BACT|nr:MAG: tRNA (adenosine(37)-N6)-dimethylallyltransferase MiaA [bacterium (Candidatus Blackallbacteria) CG18_big_fil_WC_8_21_14_2_50_49_26]PIW17079.1 MAG: tRNA (adenosine(37)-N6)-dimethylallyltransferase MiaA [bacterium (Candidatus Blackallbacteria) CG17_big_fil_post_rev_8_21_14_2_50_48_46]PIW47686.1 MAG: tRNA (adenosine(37)-N6)-dimethylallyltransferase MiaA [bacterium (Candidatus Blackallbacteria) CG13_big_fil_rev_8_21_14_2_50_49_14]